MDIFAPSSSGSSIRHQRAFHSKLKCHLFKNSYLDSSDHQASHLNDIHLNSYSVWCAWLLSGALEIPRLRLRT